MDPLAPVPVSAPARVRQWLSDAPDGPVPVLHTGPQAVYVDVAGRAVGLLAAGAVLVPNGLRSRLPALPHEGAAYVERGVLHLGARPFRVGRTVDVRVPRLGRTPADGPAYTPGPDTLDRHLGSPLPLDVGPLVVRRLLGRGPGLTPLGDDVVAGWLGAARALGVATPEVDDAVRADMHRTTTLSATLLACALHGEAVPELGGYLRALGTPSAEQHATALRRVGATSGAGLLAGAHIALRQLTTRGALVA